MNLLPSPTDPRPTATGGMTRLHIGERDVRDRRMAGDALVDVVRAGERGLAAWIDSSLTTGPQHRQRRLCALREGVVPFRPQAVHPLPFGATDVGLCELASRRADQEDMARDEELDRATALRERAVFHESAVDAAVRAHRRAAVTEA